MRKLKPGKIFIVIFLTVIIWVWADLRITEQYTIPNLTVSVAKSVNPNLAVSFGSDESDFSISQTIITGPAAKLAKLRRSIEEGEFQLNLPFDPEQYQMTESGRLDVLDFLRKNDSIKQYGLTIKSCKPEAVQVNLTPLVKKSLTVVCVDTDMVPIQDAIVEPDTVEMFVPRDWSGEKLTAYVRLADPERQQANIGPFSKKPYIELPGGHRKEARTVQITTPPKPDRLGQYQITATLAIALSPILRDEYKVEITNLTDILSGPITIKATPEAKDEYENQPAPPMTLYILDEDKKTTEEQKKAVVYNFPEEYVRRDEIRLDQQPVIAKFKVLPLAPTLKPAE